MYLELTGKAKQYDYVEQREIINMLLNSELTKLVVVAEDGRELDGPAGSGIPCDKYNQPQYINLMPKWDAIRSIEYALILQGDPNATYKALFPYLRSIYEMEGLVVIEIMDMPEVYRYKLITMLERYYFEKIKPDLNHKIHLVYMPTNRKK